MVRQEHQLNEEHNTLEYLEHSDLVLQEATAFISFYSQLQQAHDRDSMPAASASILMLHDTFTFASPTRWQAILAMASYARVASTILELACMQQKQIR